MNNPEFKKLIGYFFSVFPTWEEWLQKTSNPDATMESWFRCLQYTDVAHATIAVDRMVDGKVALPAYYDRDRIALHIRAAAQMIADRERKQLDLERKRQEQQPRWQGDGFSCAAEYRRLLAELDAKKQVIKGYPT